MTQTDGKQQNETSAVEDGSQPGRDPYQLHQTQKDRTRLLWGIFSLLLIVGAALALLLPQYVNSTGQFGDQSPPLQANTQTASNQSRETPSRRESGPDHNLQAAQAYERFERWQDAIEAYERVLSLDPDNSDAEEGRTRSVSRNNLDRYLTNILADPWRLTETETYLQTVGIYNNALTIGPPNTRLSNQLRELRNPLEAAGQTRAVTIISDAETHITLNGSGELGTFSTHTVQLRPGTYSLSGVHSNCENMRTDFTVPLMDAVPLITLRCEAAEQ